MMGLLSELFGAMKAGWLQYVDQGMYLGVFFVALLFLWLVCYDKFAADGKLLLFRYALVSTALVLCPISAFFLLKYQTAFYTYSQLFLLLPMTLVMAWALTEFFEFASGEILKEKKTHPQNEKIHSWSGKTHPGIKKMRPWVAETAVILVIVFVLFMAGNLSFASQPTNKAENNVKISGSTEMFSNSKIPGNIEEVLAEICESDLDLSQEIILATDEVLEYARAYSADLKLLYGRNMWIKELNAYTYDTYSEELKEVHTWLNPDQYTFVPVLDNITAEEAMDFILANGATLLVLEKQQFADAAVYAALEEVGYVKLGETSEYVIIRPVR